MEAEMRVGLTNVGTLSLWLAWLWNFVVVISSKLSTQVLSGHTKCFTGCLWYWFAKSKENCFHFPANGMSLCGRDIEIINSLLSVHCATAQYEIEIWIWNYFIQVGQYESQKCRINKVGINTVVFLSFSSNQSKNFCFTLELWFN